MTAVINLKGHLREYGPRLEHAPASLVYVGRRFTMGGWNPPGHQLFNPFKVGALHTRTDAINRYREHLLARPDLLALIPELCGRILACWCAPEPCHAHVLAALADETPIPNVPEGQLF